MLSLLIGFAPQITHATDDLYISMFIAGESAWSYHPYSIVVQVRNDGATQRQYYLGIMLASGMFWHQLVQMYINAGDRQHHIITIFPVCRGNVTLEVDLVDVKAGNLVVDKRIQTVNFYDGSVPYLEDTVFAHSQQISALNTTQMHSNFTMQGMQDNIETLETKITSLSNIITALEIALAVVFFSAISSLLVMYAHLKKQIRLSSH
jgi:hypothetical protein